MNREMFKLRPLFSWRRNHFSLLETFDVSESNKDPRVPRVSDSPLTQGRHDRWEHGSGTTPELFTARLDEWGADVIGLNCGVGPAIILTALEKMRRVTKKKLAAQPNAGLPRDVQGRQFYMCSPEYMSKFAKRLIQSGAKFIGGCCGTTPAHIKLIPEAVRAASPRAQKFVMSSAPVRRVEEVSLAEIKVVHQRSDQSGRAKLTLGEFVTP